jgi:hypothetical protein
MSTWSGMYGGGPPPGYSGGTVRVLIFSGFSILLSSAIFISKYSRKKH